jgi:hypothetical protein
MIKRKVYLMRRPWWRFIHEDLQELLKESIFLSENVKRWKEHFHDYSFIVFPAAKAYEGFLKKLFLEQGYITEQDFTGKRFRIGRALNPALDSDFRHDDSIYDRILVSNGLEGRELANTLWETWRNCRNTLFHWFPDEKNYISYPEAVSRIKQVIAAIDLAYESYTIKEES